MKDSNNLSEQAKRNLDEMPSEAKVRHARENGKRKVSPLVEADSDIPGDALIPKLMRDNPDKTYHYDGEQNGNAVVYVYPNQGESRSVNPPG